MAVLPLPMRTSAGSIILVLSLLLATGGALAHNGEPMPMPRGDRPAKTPADLRNIKTPPRWNWLHWWEANRDRFLHAPEQEGTLQPAETEQLNALRAEAAGELLKAIETSTRPSLTIEAAIALGKMRHEPALPTLVNLSKNERADVRRAALVAMGLLGSPEAEKELLAFKPTRDDERPIAIAAFGLLPKMDAATLRQVRAMLAADASAEKADKIGTSAVITWSLRHHRKEDNFEYFRAVLRTSLSPWVTSEALLGLGGTKDHAAQRLLEDTLFGNVLGQVKAYDNLEQLLKNKTRILGRDAAEPIRDEEGRNLEETGRVQAGPEIIAMSWMRSSAAIALGELDAPRAGEVLLQFLDEDLLRYPHLVTPMEFAIMSLTAYPTEATRDKFIGLVGKQDDKGKLKLDVPKDSPLRGFAALALGLYAKPHATDQGPADRPHADWAVMTLTERLEDDREEEEVRTACAVALGLTQRSAVLPAMQKLSAKLEQRNRKPDQALLGFIMLGRALAGEKALVEPAGKHLGRGDDVSPAGILSRRAAVLSLGLTRSANAIPVLTKAWHLNHYVNREVILALRLVGGSNAANPVMERLRQAKDQEERAYMAQALGELLAVERPTALVRLTAGSNYTVRNNDLLPLQSIANGFLFDYLIASFGEQW